MVFVGTSGWQYTHWRGLFYPERLPSRLWLEHYSARFRAVEVNNTFYRLPRAEVFEQWAQRTPPDFVLALKMSRYLSHIRRLRDPDEAVALFLERAAPLRAKCGPLLLQLPPGMTAAPDRLDHTLALVPAPLRVAVEFRDASWYTDRVRSVLERHGAALCLADRAAEPLSPPWRTAPWTYLRFHEGTGRPRPCYRRETLRAWAERLAASWSGGDDLWAFFNNDPAGCAVRDATRFAEALHHVGFTPTRVPPKAETPVAAG